MAIELATKDLMAAAFNAGALIVAYGIGMRRLNRDVKSLKNFKKWALQMLLSLKNHHELNHPGQNIHAGYQEEGEGNV